MDDQSRIVEKLFSSLLAPASLRKLFKKRCRKERKTMTLRDDAVSFLRLLSESVWKLQTERVLKEEKTLDQKGQYELLVSRVLPGQLGDHAKSDGITGFNATLLSEAEAECGELGEFFADLCNAIEYYVLEILDVGASAAESLDHEYFCVTHLAQGFMYDSELRSSLDEASFFGVLRNVFEECQEGGWKEDQQKSFSKLLWQKGIQHSDLEPYNSLFNFRPLGCLSTGDDPCEEMYHLALFFQFDDWNGKTHTAFGYGGEGDADANTGLFGLVFVDMKDEFRFDQGGDCVTQVSLRYEDDGPAVKGSPEVKPVVPDGMLGQKVFDVEEEVKTYAALVYGCVDMCIFGREQQFVEQKPCKLNSRRNATLGLLKLVMKKRQQNGLIVLPNDLLKVIAELAPANLPPFSSAAYELYKSNPNCTTVELTECYIPNGANVQVKVPLTKSEEDD